MHTGIDFLAQDLLGALDRQNGDLLSQCLTGTNHLLLGLSLGSGDDLGRFLGRAGLGLLDQALSATICISQAVSRFLAGGSQFCFNTLVGRSEFALCTVGGSKAIGNFLRPLVQRLSDRGPHEFHREPHQDRKDDGLQE